jgi:hypothetical protein
MDKILLLDPDDDIIALRSRINSVLPELVRQADASKRRPPRLLLDVPGKNKALHTLVNMKLLARTVKARTVELAIVSKHPAVRDYAKVAGVKVFGSVRAAKRTKWVRADTPLTPPTQTAAPVLPTAASPVKMKSGRPKKRKYVLVLGKGRVGFFQQFGALILVAVLSAALFVGVMALLPQATVTLTPIAKAVQAELIVKADPSTESVDFQNLTFPARVSQVELEISGQIETIDTELAPVGQAGGTVVFVNRTDQEQTIPVSSTVTTSAGEQIEFITIQTATIPAGVGALTPTQVIAVEPGPQGNVPAGQINRLDNPTYSLLARVVNEQKLEGGTLEPARVVVQADKERLQAHLQQLIYQAGLEQLRQSLAEQEFVSPETLQVIVLDVTYNEFAGDVSDTFSGEMQAVVRGTVVGGYNANRLALTALETQTPAGYELDIEGLHFGAGEVLDVQNGVVTFRVFANGQAVPLIDSYAVARSITWLSVGQAQALLNGQYPLAAVPGIELQPDWAVKWVGRLPYSSVRINVIINNAVAPVAGNG